MTRPGTAEYAEFQAGYVALVPETDVLPVLESELALLHEQLAGVPGERETYSYTSGKWSIRQVVGHMADAERVFAYRALWLARNGKVPLPGFDQDEFAAAAGHGGRPLRELVAELAAVRESNLALLRSLPSEAWMRSGVVNDRVITVRAIAWIMAGHWRHHMAILKDRYGI